MEISNWITLRLPALATSDLTHWDILPPLHSFTTHRQSIILKRKTMAHNLTIILFWKLFLQILHVFSWMFGFPIFYSYASFYSRELPLCLLTQTSTAFLQPHSSFPSAFTECPPLCCLLNPTSRSISWAIALAHFCYCPVSQYDCKPLEYRLLLGPTALW